MEFAPESSPFSDAAAFVLLAAKSLAAPNIAHTVPPAQKDAPADAIGRHWPNPADCPRVL